VNNKVFKTRTADRKPVDAQEYINKRFGSKKMQRIDKVEQDFAEDLLKRIGRQGTVLDAPCGSGRFTPILSRARKLYALDINQGMLNEARKKAIDENDCQFIEGSILEIPLAKNSVDLVFCMRLLHHVGLEEDRAAIFKEVARVSKQWVAVTFYRKESWKYIRKRIRGKNTNGQPIRCSRFYREANEHGLKLVESTNIRNNMQTLALFHVS
jgi:ubiquinone/menaquinone biosynthesis C-methylase UbiE